MPIRLVQQVKGTGATLTLTGVQPGSLLTLQSSIFRVAASGSAALNAPTDTQGTWSTAQSSTLTTMNPGGDFCGAAIFYQALVASGTHTITPDSLVTSKNHTFAEWSNVASSPFDKTNITKVSRTNHTSTSTGTTGTLSQSDELVLIALSLAAAGGVSDVGFTDPVSTYLTMHKIPNDQTDIATFHAFKIVSATTAENPTFNWTSSEAEMGSQAVIATFKQAYYNIAWTRA